MKKVVLLWAVFMIFQVGFSQDNDNVDILSHEVRLGETVRLISKKYLVNPAEIYKLNKFATDGINPGMVLRIPVPHKDVAVKEEQPLAETSQETVQPTETPVQEQPVAEATVTKKKGKRPMKEVVAENQGPAADVAPTETAVASASPADSTFEHTVKSGETLFSLARQYNVTVDQIREINPAIKKGLKIGQSIRIPGAGSATASAAPQAPPQIEKPQPASNEGPTSAAGVSIETAVSHEVKSGETLYGLAKKYNISVVELKAQNPDIEKKGLQSGQVLTIKKAN